MVVDSEFDNSVAIAKKFNCKLVIQKNNGYVSAIRGKSKSGFDTYILIRSKFRDGRYLLNEMVILEIDEPNGIACVVSENTHSEYNQEHIYLEIYEQGADI